MRENIFQTRCWLLELPVGGGSENVYYGQDATGLAKVVKPYGVHIRSTHGGFQPFPDNEGSMLKRVSTPAHFYGDPHWLEPPSTISEGGEIGRFMENLSAGSHGYWTWSGNPGDHPQLYPQYQNYLTQEKPQVDVALFFPTTDHRLHPQNGYPVRLAGMAAQLRDVMNYDTLDENLIADGALKNYRVLLMLDGDVLEQGTLEKLSQWVRNGGVVLRFTATPLQTVSGETKSAAQLFGFTSAPTTGARPAAGKIEIGNGEYSRHLKSFAGGAVTLSNIAVNARAKVLAQVGARPLLFAMPQGRGFAMTFAANDDEFARRTFYEAARDAVYNLSKLDKTKRDAVEIDAAWDGVYAVKLANEAIFYNAGNAEKTVNVLGQSLTLPPISIRSARLK